jgi:hypothetical protein
MDLGLANGSRGLSALSAVPQNFSYIGLMAIGNVDYVLSVSYVSCGLVALIYSICQYIAVANWQKISSKRLGVATMTKPKC